MAALGSGVAQSHQFSFNMAALGSSDAEAALMAYQLRLAQGSMDASQLEVLVLRMQAVKFLREATAQSEELSKFVVEYLLHRLGARPAPQHSAEQPANSAAVLQPRPDVARGAALWQPEAEKAARRAACRRATTEEVPPRVSELDVPGLSAGEKRLCGKLDMLHYFVGEEHLRRELDVLRSFMEEHLPSGELGALDPIAEEEHFGSELDMPRSLMTDGCLCADREGEEGERERIAGEVEMPFSLAADGCLLGRPGASLEREQLPDELHMLHSFVEDGEGDQFGAHCSPGDEERPLGIHGATTLGGQQPVPRNRSFFRPSVGEDQHGRGDLDMFQVPGHREDQSRLELDLLHSLLEDN